MNDEAFARAPLEESHPQSGTDEAGVEALMHGPTHDATGTDIEDGAARNRGRSVNLVKSDSTKRGVAMYSPGVHAPESACRVRWCGLSFARSR